MKHIYKVVKIYDGNKTLATFKTRKGAENFIKKNDKSKGVPFDTEKLIIETRLLIA